MTNFVPYDSADYLTDDETIAEYLSPTHDDQPPAHFYHFVNRPGHVPVVKTQDQDVVGFVGHGGGNGAQTGAETGDQTQGGLLSLPLDQGHLGQIFMRISRDDSRRVLYLPVQPPGDGPVINFYNGQGVLVGHLKMKKFRLNRRQVKGMIIGARRERRRWSGYPFPCPLNPFPLGHHLDRAGILQIV